MNHKKTGWTITLIAVLAIACGGIVIKLCPRTVPIEECSPVYRKFADMPGIEVSYVKDYRINDFLRRAKGLGVPMSNSYYRDLYHCLEYFGLLDEGQVRQHNALNQPQVREQYIQKRVRRL